MTAPAGQASGAARQAQTAQSLSTQLRLQARLPLVALMPHRSRRLQSLRLQLLLAAASDAAAGA
jgi:hypothetical protein